MNKSAKDKAFDKERQKLKRQIREKEAQIQERNEQIEELKLQINELEAQNREREEWIERLLEYTELSKEDIEKEMKARAAGRKAAEQLQSIAKILNIGQLY